MQVTGLNRELERAVDQVFRTLVQSKDPEADLNRVVRRLFRRFDEHDVLVNHDALNMAARIEQRLALQAVRDSAPR